MNSRRNVLKAKASGMRSLVFRKIREEETSMKARKFNYKVKLPIQRENSTYNDKIDTKRKEKEKTTITKVNDWEKEMILIEQG